MPLSVYYTELCGKSISFFAETLQFFGSMIRYDFKEEGGSEKWRNRMHSRRRFCAPWTPPSRRWASASRGCAGPWSSTAAFPPCRSSAAAGRSRTASTGWPGLESSRCPPRRWPFRQNSTPALRMTRSITALRSSALPITLERPAFHDRSKNRWIGRKYPASAAEDPARVSLT